MMKKAIQSVSAIALMAAAGCCPQRLLAAPSAPQASTEEVIVSVAGLYGDWRMVLPEWPGFAKPVTGDFCNFRKRDDGVSIVCADDFLQEVPEVTLDGS